jgi:hypothetical protein
MASSKKYFHDHLVLLLLSTSVFLAIFGSIFTLVRLGTGHGTGYIVQYRSSLGINAFENGGLSDMLSLVVFAIMILVIGVAISLRAYRIHRQLALAMLSLTILLLLLTVFVSNALLALR